MPLLTCTMAARPFAPSLLKRSPCLFARSASLNSAINRGLRRSPRGQRDTEKPASAFAPRTESFQRPDGRSRPSPRLDSAESARPSPRLDFADERNRSPTRYVPRTESDGRPHYTRTDFSKLIAPSAQDRRDPAPSPPEEGSPSTEYYSWRPFARPNPRLDNSAPPPGADWTPKVRRFIPKSNPDSEWIYGTSAVEAALKARKRTFYKLHILAVKNRTPENKARDRTMSDLAAAADVEVVYESDSGLLDSMSNSRPHNGYVLECLPLPKIPILSLGAVDPANRSFALELAQHHHTTGALINPKDHQTVIPCRDPSRRYPFVLMLDEILDPGNLGAILRSAYYLGVDAITLSSRNCAPLSPACLKASAGAAELIPILEQSRSDKLITASAGWTFYAGIPPPTKNQARRDRYVFASEVAAAAKSGPTALVLGGEGTGLRPFLKKHVRFCVSLDRGPGTDGVVDSLNVSVAAALLCSAFLRG